LQGAAVRGDVRAITILATHPELINTREPNGWTPLANAAGHGRTEAVRVLSWLGGDVNMPVESGATPNYVASECGERAGEGGE
jgi:ankyrin repeat protein